MTGSPPRWPAELGALDPAFTGWCLAAGRLCPAEYSGQGFTPGEILALPIQRMRIRELEKLAWDARHAVSPRHLALVAQELESVEAAFGRLRRRLAR